MGDGDDSTSIYQDGSCQYPRYVSIDSHMHFSLGNQSQVRVKGLVGKVKQARFISVMHWTQFSLLKERTEETRCC